MNAASRQALKQAALQSPNPQAQIFSLYQNLERENAQITNFISRRDALVIYIACKGIGKDDETLIQVICNRTKRQLKEIDLFYRQMPMNESHKSLIEKLNSELSGDYCRFMKSLVESSGQFNAHQLRKAMDGIGCDQALVNEIFCTATNAEIQEMKQVFEQQSDKSLLDRLKSELSGNHETLILQLLMKGRSEQPRDDAKARGQATELATTIKQGGTMMGGLSNSAELRVIEIIGLSSVDQCIAIKAAYEQQNVGKPSLDALIESKFSSHLRDALLLLLREPIDIYCQKLKAATDGMGTNEAVVSRVLGGNDKPVIRRIIDRYMSKYNVDLKDLMRRELGGDYRTAVLTWLDCTDPTGGSSEINLIPLTATSPQAEIVARVDYLIAGNERLKEFTAALDADLLKRAARGVGTDERMVVNILCSRTKSQIDRIDMSFRQKYNRTLKEYIEREMGSNLKIFLTYTQMAEDEFDALILHEAFAGIGCDKKIVVEILTTRSWKRLQEARAYYERRYDSGFLDRLRSEVGGSLGYLCVKIMEGCRGHAEEGNNLTESPEYVADQLYAGGAGRWGTDEKGFIDIITKYNLAELRQIGAAYEAKHRTSLEAAIKSEFSGDLEMALVALVNDSIDFFARRLKDAAKGLGTNEAVINRILGGNDKETVHRISDRYFAKYDQLLVVMLKSELSGDYLNACVNWVETLDYTEGLEAQVAATFTPKPVAAITHAVPVVATAAPVKTAHPGVLPAPVTPNTATALPIVYGQPVSAATNAPYSQPPGGAYGVPPNTQPAAYGMPPVPYAQPAYGQAPAPYAQPGYGQAPAPYAQPGYGQQPAPYAQPAYGMPQAPYAQPAYGQAPAPYVQPAYGQAPAPYAQPVYGQAPAPYAQPAYGQAPAPYAQPPAAYGAPPPYGVPQLPQGWEEKVAPDGKHYFVNHVTHTTQWNRP